MCPFVPDNSGSSLTPETHSSSPIPTAPAVPAIAASLQPPINSVNDNLKFLPMISLQKDKLPSKGLSYPENAAISYRPYTFGEIKKASQSKMSFRENLDFVLEGVTCNFDKLKITLFDVMYLSLLRNISSIKGAGFTIPFTCGACGKNQKHELELSGIEFKDIEASKLPITVTLQGKLCVFMPLTLEDFYALMEVGKEDDDLSLMAVKIRNRPFEESYSIIESLTGDDQDVAMDIETLLNHEIMPLKFNCSNVLSNEQKCSNPVELELVGGEALIMPFRKAQNTVRSRIQFG